MPTSMYWVLERQAADHSWSAVLSNLSLARHGQGRQVEAGMALGAPNPEFFAVMSGLSSKLRTRYDRDIEPFAANGMPQDISDYAKGILVHPLPTGGPLRKAPLNNHGHFRLDTLVDAASTGRQDILPYEVLPFNSPAADYLRLLQVRLSILIGLDPYPPTGIADREILVGRAIDTYSGRIIHEGMDALSMHEKLRLHLRLTNLLPQSLKTTRFLFAYSC